MKKYTLIVSSIKIPLRLADIFSRDYFKIKFLPIE